MVFSGEEEVVGKNPTSALKPLLWKNIENSAIWHRMGERTRCSAIFCMVKPPLGAGLIMFKLCYCMGSKPGCGMRIETLLLLDIETPLWPA